MTSTSICWNCASGLTWQWQTAFSPPTPAHMLGYLEMSDMQKIAYHRQECSASSPQAKCGPWSCCMWLVELLTGPEILAVE